MFHPSVIRPRAPRSRSLSVAFASAVTLAACGIVTFASSVRAEMYRDLYWPKPVTNEAAVERLLRGHSYSPDPDIARAQIQRDATIDAANIRARSEELKARLDALDKSTSRSRIDLNMRGSTR